MGFGAELKDFVGAFESGYKMTSDREERKNKKAQQEADFKRTGEWHDDDKNYRDDKFEYDKAQDSWRRGKWEQEFDYRRRQDGTIQGRWEEQQSADEKDRQLKRDALRIGAAKDGVDPEQMRERDGYVAPTDRAQPQALPDDEQSLNDTGDATLQQTSTSTGDFSLRNYLASVKHSESGGRLRAKNSESSAYGPYQFLRGTWDQLARQHPKLGLTHDGRDDPEQNERAIRQFTYNNALALDRAGIPVTNGTVYAAHFLGPGDAPKLLRHSSDTPVSEVLGRKTLSANPFLRGMTVGDFRRWAERKGNSRSRRRQAIPDDGAVSAASGGLIEETAPDDFILPMDEAAPIPEERPADAPVATAIPEEQATVPAPDYSGEVTSEGKEEPTDDPWEQGRRAVRDGMKKSIKDAGMDRDDGAIDDPELEAIRQNYLKGYGAAPSQMMKQVADKIDPDKQMPPAERNMKAMGTVYQYYMEKGEPEKAQAAAASMVQYYRGASQQFLALAQSAAENGDLDNAAKMAIAAYANIPNGRDMSIKKTEDGQYDISVVDIKTGKTVNKKLLPPDQFAAAAMGFNAKTFDDEILNAAGVPADKYTDASVADISKVAEAAQMQAEEMFPDMLPARRSLLADSAASIAAIKENGLSASDALRLVDPGDDARGFAPALVPKAVRGNPDLVEVTAGEQKVIMRKNTLRQLLKDRATVAGEQQALNEKRKTGAKDTENTIKDFSNAGDKMNAAADEAMQVPDKIVNGAIDTGKDIYNKLIVEPTSVKVDRQRQDIVDAIAAYKKQPDPEEFAGEISELEARLRMLDSRGAIPDE